MSINLEPNKPRSQAGRGQREGRVNIPLGAARALAAQARAAEKGIGMSEYVRALVDADLQKSARKRAGGKT